MAMKEIKGVGKQHWMYRYVDRLNSEEGMSAEEIYEEENARRAAEGLPLLKFNSVGRTLNTFGYPKSGTKRKQLEEVKQVRIGVFIKELKRKVEKLSELIKEENLSPLEQEFVWLFIEDYPESQIRDMLHLDEEEMQEIKKKLHLS
ncbi:hypothetical protein DRN80_04925 [Methanosarcinales archaeon]|nr:MAG: hypothetical protein DRN80_04925 [Methanosarcinales archaeon]